jgi:hypothetical protein
MADAYLRGLGNVVGSGIDDVYTFPNPADTQAGKVLQGDGLQITLKKIKGMTDPDVLQHPFRFQCPPMDTFSRSYSYTYTDYNAISQGQFSRPSGVDLASVTFQTLFVDFDAPWSNLRGTPEAQNASLDPQQMTQQLLKILRRGTPFELIVGQRALWNSNDVHWGPANGNAATLRTLDIEERAGEIDARYVNVGFTEFRTAELVRKGLGDGDGKNRDPKRGRDLPTSVVIKVGDNTTLTDLARKYYGSTAEWRSIAKRNGMSWQQNRSLGDWVKSQGDKQRTIVIPEIETLKTLGTFLAGKAGAAAAA